MGVALIGPERPRARRGPPPDAYGTGHETGTAIGRSGPTPEGRGPFDRPVRRAALQARRLAAPTLLPADQNALRQSSAHNEYGP